MRACESPFQSYKSKRILSFATFTCSSVSGPKELKMWMRFAILSYSQKLWNVFEIVLEKCEVLVQKSLSWKIFRKKKIADTCLLLCVHLPTVNIWGQSDKFPTSFSSLHCPLQVKNWFEKTALNMSIRRVIFTSGQNLKPPFLCQYLVFFNDFFSALQISSGSLL